MNTFVEIILIFLMLVLNGVFAMSEIAVLSARKLRLQQRAEDGDRGARAALELNENPNRFLSTVQIGITLISIFTGALGGATLAERLAGVLDTLAIPWMTASTAEGLSLAVVVLLTTYFSLVIGELIPKRLALGDPDKIARSVSPAMRILARLTAPIVQLLSWSTDLGLKLIGARDSDEPPVTEEEIKGLMEQGTQVGIFETAEQDMVSSVFRLGGRYVDALMTPRTEIEWIDLEEPFEEIRHQIIVSNHTRFPTGRGGLDNVQGVLLARDFLTRCMENSTPVDIEELLQPPLFVPDSMSALKVLQMLKDAGMHVALVI
ncbi:MAG TPA: hemolysin family protein, partial [Anaerolineaceae bacterium]|nr:hemolysin family protein [Anaerolineaceae bacterium]